MMALDLILAVACALLLGVSVALQKRGIGSAWRESIRSPVWLAGAGLELIADGCYLGAASATGARLTIMQPIVVLHFLVAMAVGLIALRERFSAREWLAAGVLVVGGALVLASAFMSTPAAEHGADRSLALALTLAALALGVLGGVAVRRMHSSETLTAICAGLVFSGSVVATRIAGMDYRAGDDGLVHLLTTSVAPLLVVVGSVGGFVLMQQALRAGRAAIVSPVVALVTLVVPLPIGVAVFHEDMPATSAAGSMLVAVALVLLLTAASRASHLD